MKLELKHIVGYLPYDLEMIFESKGGRKIKLSSISKTPLGIAFSGGSGGMWLAESNFKPILRPLSNLTKEIEFNGEKFVPIKKLGYNENWVGLKSHFENAEYLPYKDIQKLYEWHFDVHGLIEKGLAIDINNLEP